ncbi:uncharacterized protein [Salminus brasiliensis]|uniref:uncharacterized protein isoform X2 n=1 Tax=Salminus brasiliensis TaxID=930266 RepID=UPI003B8319AA
MTAPKAEEIKRGIAVIWENLQCPICLDLMNAPVSTRCDHQFCRFCMMKLLERSKRKETSCPVCKMKVTKRSLQESPGFQRLVEGLQKLVQSYEFDTSTSYFTGMPQRRKETSVETESRDQQHSEENAYSENDVMDKSASHSSSAAAKDAFAKLMGLPDSCPVSSEQDCFDSGLGDLLQDPGNKPGELEDVPSGTEDRLSNSLPCNDGSPEGEADGHQKQPIRRSKRVGLEPDRIVDKRKKKSVEKVAEWLLKISPSSDTQGRDHSGALPDSDDGDSERDSVCSSSPTELNVKAGDTDDGGPPKEKEVPSRGLEEKVFGAVYKRDRRSVKAKVNRDVSPEREIVTEPDAFNLVEEEEEEVIKRNVSKRKRSRVLTPADFIKKSSSDDGEMEVVCDRKEVEDSEESHVRAVVEENELDVNVELNTDGQIKRLEERDGFDTVAEEVDETLDDAVENMEESPVFEVPLKRPQRRLKSKMQDIWQDVNLDLKEKENIRDNRTTRKRRILKNDSERTRASHLEECRKSLTLVDAARNEDVDLMEQLKMNHKVVEAEINIESYPSTAEPRSPEARRTRRSLRLQAFTAEIQGMQKRRRSSKGARKAANANEKNPLDDQSPSNGMDQPQVDNTDANGVDTAEADPGQGNAVTHQLHSGQTEEFVRKNGCVCNSDLGNIEAVQTNDEAAPVTCLSEGRVLERSSVVTVIPDTVDKDSVAVGSASPLQAVALDSSLPEKRQESPSAGVVAPSVVQTLTDGPCESGCEEEEDEHNESELDTEVLMKSFKAVKRKSFHLGSPKPSPAKGQQGALNKTREEGEQQQQESQIPTVCKDTESTSDLGKVCHSGLLQSPNPCKLPVYEKQSQRSLSTVASVSLLQANPESQKEAFLKNSGNSTSTGLSPNKVARSSQDSKLPTNSDSANSCQLLFSSAPQEEPQICSSSVHRPELSPKSGTCQPRTAEMSIDNTALQRSLDSNKSPNIPVAETPTFKVHSNNLESSITPDGLLPEAAAPHAHKFTEPTASQSFHELPSQPCVPKRRRAQRLESSDSEISIEDDSLPSLAHIFKSHRSPSPSGQEPLRKSEWSNQEHGQPLSEPAAEAHSSQLSQCVGPSQSQECLENADATADGMDLQGRSLPQPPCGDDWVTSSQGSVDLFGTPEESEAVGICGNAAISRDSSQYSSEIINTQKEEMHQELRRLERMMALVSEALQKKELDSEAKTQTEGPNPTHSDQQSAPDLDAAAQSGLGKSADRQSGLDSGRDCGCAPPGPEAPEGPCAPESQPPLTRGQANTAAGQRARTSRQKSRGSARRSSPKSEAGPEVRNHVATSEGSVAELTKEGNEAKDALREIAGAGNMSRLGISSTAGKMELVASGLSASELMLVKKFARKMQGHLSKEMTPTTTHVIIKTDEDLVCERTLKYFQGIAGRKWVLSYLWISECFKQGKVLDEAQFEVRGDMVNGHNHNGPLKSRTTADDDLLMKGYEICFQGSFTGMTTDQMETMVEMCGATIMKDPLMFSKHVRGKCQLVVVQPGSDDSQSYYRALQKKATVVTRSWLLDTIATYTLQNPEDYKP